MFGTTDLVNCF